ncbi:MAG TPA: hypothetical protein VMI56_12880 [Reyranella sp.]|nr:hypothetical protein [Reyranella sp.]
MLNRAIIAGLLALSAGACATEHRTVVVASDDACTRYGFTQSTEDYIRCQRMIAAQRRAGRVAADVAVAQVMADSQAACVSYGIPRGTAHFDACVQDEFAARRPG